METALNLLGGHGNLGLKKLLNNRIWLIGRIDNESEL
jgi:hypothetical protein